MKLEQGCASLVAIKCQKQKAWIRQDSFFPNTAPSWLQISCIVLYKFRDDLACLRPALNIQEFRRRKYETKIDCKVTYFST